MYLNWPETAKIDLHVCLPPPAGAPHHPNLLCILYTMAFIQLTFCKHSFYNIHFVNQINQKSLIKKPLETHEEVLKKIMMVIIYTINYAL